MSLIKSVLFVVLVLGASTSFARPATKEACEDAFAKARRALNNLSDFELAVRFAPRIAELVKNASEKRKDIIAKTLGRSLRESKEQAMSIDTAACRFVEDSGARTMTKSANNSLKAFVELGILSEEDLLDEGKSEL